MTQYKPCRQLGYCPYGRLVEKFPFSETPKRCEVFGHDCPVFYVAEPFVDETPMKQSEKASIITNMAETLDLDTEKLKQALAALTKTMNG